MCALSISERPALERIGGPHFSAGLRFALVPVRYFVPGLGGWTVPHRGLCSGHRVARALLVVYGGSEIGRIQSAAYAQSDTFAHATACTEIFLPSSHGAIWGIASVRAVRSG